MKTQLIAALVVLAGIPSAVQAALSGLKALYREGQTFLTFPPVHHRRDHIISGARDR